MILSKILTGVGLTLLLVDLMSLLGPRPGLGAALSLLLGFGFFALGLGLAAMAGRRAAIRRPQP